jgi:hypothetical protein
MVWTGEGSRSRDWLMISTLVLLAVELALRVKLGPIFYLAVGWSLAWQWLSDELDDRPAPAAWERRVVSALRSAVISCSVIFVVFSLLNVVARTINPGVRWFQLP